MTILDTVTGVVEHCRQGVGLLEPDWNGFRFSREKKQFKDAETAIVLMGKALRSLSPESFGELSEVISRYEDLSGRISREVKLISGVVDREEERSAAWHRHDGSWSEFDGKEIAIQKSMHRGYLSGLRRKLVLLAQEVTLNCIGDCIRKKVGEDFEVSRKRLQRRFEELSIIAKSRDIIWCEEELGRLAERVGGLDKSSPTVKGYIADDMIEMIRKDIIDKKIYFLEEQERRLQEIELLFYLNLLQKIVEGQGDLTELIAQLTSLTSSEIPGLFEAELGHAISFDDQYTQALLDNLRKGDRGLLSSGEIKSFEPARLSEEERERLCREIVRLVETSYDDGGVFLKGVNLFESFSATLSTPGTWLTYQEGANGIQSVYPIHLQSFPEPFDRFKGLYKGSLDSGFMRLILISSALRGSRAYDRLDIRGLLLSVGKVDFLFGRLRIGEEFNFMGTRHLKAGHQPTGLVEEGEEGDRFQHLISPVNFSLRQSYQILRPKGYHPPIHRRHGLEIYRTSKDQREPYQTTPYGETMAGLTEERVRPEIYTPDSFVKEHYSELPEFPDPRHLMYRFRDYYNQPVEEADHPR